MSLVFVIGSHQRTLNIAIPCAPNEEEGTEGALEPTDTAREATALLNNAKKPLLCWFDELNLNNEEAGETEEEEETEGQSTKGVLPEVRLSKLRINAAKLARLGENEEAVNEKIRAIALVRIIYGSLHLQLARAYAELAEGYLKLRKLPLQAIKHAENSRDILLEIEAARLGEQSGIDNRVEAASVLELIYFVLGKASKMLKLFKKSDNFLQKSYLVASKKTMDSGVSLRDAYKQIEILSLLGEVSRLRKQNGQAMEWFERAIELVEEKLGNQSGEIIALYHQLGKTELQLDKGANFEKVFESYEKARTAAVSLYGKKSVEYACSCALLAKSYIICGDRAWYSSAETALEEAIMVYESSLGKNHQRTLESKESLCKLLLQRGDYNRAETNIKSIIAGKKERYGDISEPTGDSYKMLGGLYLSQNKFKPAMTKLMKSLEIYRVVLGLQSQKTKSLQKVVESIKKSPATNELNIPQEKLKERPRFNNSVSGQQKSFTKPISY